MTPRQSTLGDQSFADALAVFEIAIVYLGDRLGYYRSVAADGPATSSELASRTGTDERYAGEWLEQHAGAAILDGRASTARPASADSRYPRRIVRSSWIRKPSS